MMNCVMLVKDRPRLTHQALETFVANTDVPWTLTLVDDASQPETRDLCRTFARNCKNVALLRNEVSSGITAQVRNLGVYWSERYFGRGECLYLADNDSYFTARWAHKLVCAFTNYSPMGFQVLGGQNHPYHQPIGEFDSAPQVVREYLALAGTSQLMHWDIWDLFGPLKHGAPGVCQGEDVEFGNAIRKAGWKIGAIWPPVVLDCGITQTNGKPSPGADIKERVPGVIYE